jgi:predicted Zn-dependent protease
VLAAGVAALVLVAGIALYFAKGTAAAVEQIKTTPFALLDPVYAKRHEPVPPEPCRLASEANLLAPVAEDAKALDPLQLKSPEAHYLLARAQFDAKQPVAAALAPALGCNGFSAAQSLSGKIAVSEGRLDDAVKSFQLALAASPEFQNARFNLGAVYLKQGKKDEGVQALDQVVKAEPSRADAQLLLGVALEAQGKADEAKVHFCEADKLGESTAHERCVR